MWKRSQLQQQLRVHRWFLILLIGWTLYMTSFWAGAFFFDEGGNLYTTHINLWGDWAAHFTMGASFGYRSLLPSESPFLAEATFSYPFAINWLSGALIRLGIPFIAAFVVPSWALSILTVIAIYIWFFTWLETPKRAVTATILMLCIGGLGFVWLAQEIWQSGSMWPNLIDLPFQATNLPSQGIRWLSMVDSMIIPQRAFVMGFPWALGCLTLIYRWFIQSSHLPSYRQTICLGMALGLLPIIHMHSFLALGGVLTGWTIVGLWHRWRAGNLLQEWGKRWLVLGLVAILTAMPLFMWLFADQVGGFVRWEPGWLAPEFKLSWWDFWLRNWGPTLLLAIGGLAVSRTMKNSQYGWPFLIWFILPNVFIFQPWNWDNTKLIIWSALGIVGFATQMLAWLWKRSTVLVRSLVVILASITILSGAIDLYWIQRRSLHTYQMHSAENWHLAQWVIAHTPNDSRWLTGAEHNHWLFNLTGRQTLMAYRGWLWTQGYDYLAREGAVTSLFVAPSLAQLHHYRVQYVVVGPEERTVWKASDAAFLQVADPIYSTENTVIYRVKPLN